MLETADRFWGQTLGTWLNVGGLALLVVGKPVLAPLQSAKPSLKNLASSLDGPFLAVKQRMYPNILLTRVMPNLH